MGRSISDIRVMKISLKKTDASPYSVEAENESGNKLTLDGAEKIGGANAGFRPMELVATALAGCSTIDVLSILKKQRQDVRDLKIDVDAHRRADEVPSIFDTIHVSYTFFGDLRPDAVEKALHLSFEKYCSVGMILRPTCVVTYSYTIEP
jgi:putative redox protein